MTQKHQEIETLLTQLPAAQEADHRVIGCLIHDNIDPSRFTHENVTAVYDAIRPYLLPDSSLVAAQEQAGRIEAVTDRCRELERENQRLRRAVANASNQLDTVIRDGILPIGTIYIGRAADEVDMGLRGIEGPLRQALGVQPQHIPAMTHADEVLSTLPGYDGRGQPVKEKSDE